MSRSPYRPPFHRRILPWVFLAIFLGLAPVVVFYTAGYRYNPKKNLVERNGTVIIDSTPRGATVLLDQRPTDETSPVTLQNVTPGMHTLRLERPIYHPWEKTLDVRAEQVSFANDIWLWRVAEPELIATGSVVTLAENSNRNALAVVLGTAPNSRLHILDEDGLSTGIALDAGVEARTIRWREGGSELLVGGFAPDQRAWLVHTAPALRADALTSGWYTWFEGAVVGSDGQAAIRYSPRSGTVERTPFAAGTRAAIGDLTLTLGSSTRELLLTDDRAPDRALRLPNGAWVPQEERNGRWFFTDRGQWLALATADREPLSSRSEGDRLRWDGDGRRAIMLNQTEMKLWDGITAPDPVWRQSDELVEALWHRSGQTIFFATKTQLQAMELDSRGGRQITGLASFDQITNLAILGRDLVVAGRKGGVEGMWRLRVE